MTHDQIRLMKFPVEMSPIDIKLGNIENLISYEHGLIQLHPREMDGSPQWSYGIEKYSDYEKVKREQQLRLQEVETPSRQVHMKTVKQPVEQSKDLIHQANMQEIIQEQKQVQQNLQAARNNAKKSKEPLRFDSQISHPNQTTTIAEKTPIYQSKTAHDDVIAKSKMRKSLLYEQPITSPHKNTTQNNTGNLQLFKPIPVKDILKSFDAGLNSSNFSNLGLQRKKILKNKMKMIQQLVIKEKIKLEDQLKFSNLNNQDLARLEELQKIYSRMRKKTLNFIEVSQLSSIENAEISYIKASLQAQQEQQKQVYAQKVEQIEDLQKQIEEDRIKAIMEEKMRQAELQMQEDSQVQVHIKMNKEVNKQKQEMENIQKKLEEEKHKVSAQKYEIAQQEKNLVEKNKAIKQKIGKIVTAKKVIAKKNKKIKEGIAVDEPKGDTKQVPEKKVEKEKKKKPVEEEPKKKKGWFGGMFKKKKDKKSKFDENYLDDENNSKYKGKETKRIKLPFSKCIISPNFLTFLQKM